MSLFMCRQCGCVENSALGSYWSADTASMWPDGELLAPRCSECGPQRYRDGSRTDFGQWHGKFPKRSASGMLVDSDGGLWSSVPERMHPNFKIIGSVS